MKDKVVIITGASSGIGEGVAKRFLAEGAKVVGCGIEDKMNIVDENAIYVQANLTKYEDAVKVAEKAAEHFGTIHSLICCAGVTGVGTLETTTAEEFARQMNINVNGVFHMCKASIGYLKENEDASIVIVGSDLGVRPIPDRVSYCPSKAAAIMLAKCIAAEYAPKVRANCILPGLVRTPMIESRFQEAEDPEALERSFAEMYPLKKMGTVEDMANAILYLASTDSTYVTGECIGVCGGSLI